MIQPIDKASKTWNPKLGCMVYTPDGWDNSKKLPLIVFLHGTGEGGSNEWDLDNNGPLMEASRGRKIPAIVIAFQFPVDNDWWNEVAIDWIADTLRHPDFRKEYNTFDKVGITGLSAGSRGAVMFAVRHPELVSSVSVVAVRGYKLDQIERAKNIPFWILTNKGDGNDWDAPLKAIKAIGGIYKIATSDGKTTLWDGSSHDSWTRAYALDELYRWHAEWSEPDIVEPTPTEEPAQEIVIDFAQWKGKKVKITGIPGTITFEVPN